MESEASQAVRAAAEKVPPQQRLSVGHNNDTGAVILLVSDRQVAMDPDSAAVFARAILKHAKKGAAIATARRYASPAPLKGGGGAGLLARAAALGLAPLRLDPAGLGLRRPGGA